MIPVRPHRIFKRRFMPPRPDRSVVIWGTILLGAAVYTVEFLPGIFDFTFFEWYQRPAFLIPFVIALIYGIHRAWSYHPLSDRAYLAWLGQMPWRPSMPLPFGTILPTWIDVLAVALLALPSMLSHPVFGPLVVIVGAIAGYSLTMVPFLSATGLHRHNYTIAFLIGLGGLLSVSIWATLAVSIAVLLVAAHGVHRSLFRLALPPTTAPNIGAHLLGNLKVRGDQDPQPALHPSRPPLNTFEAQPLPWPYVALMPRDPSPRLSRERAILIPLIIGWLTFIFWHLQRTGLDPLPPVLGLFAALAVALARLVIYTASRPSAVPLDPRFSLGIVIIPRYDVVFIAPAAAAGVALTLWWILRILDMPDALAAALPIAAALWIVLLAPPSLGTWDLTGAHRLKPLQPR